MESGNTRDTRAAETVNYVCKTVLHAVSEGSAGLGLSLKLCGNSNRKIAKCLNDESQSLPLYHPSPSAFQEDGDRSGSETRRGPLSLIQGSAADELS